MDQSNEDDLTLSLKRLKIASAFELVQEEEYSVSPSTPLLSTAIDDNGWISGRLLSSKSAIGRGAAVKSRALQVGQRWATLSMSSGHSAGVSMDGKVYTWGKNNKGQLGREPGRECPEPAHLRIMDGVDVRGIACGDEHTVAITAMEVFSWGSNDCGQCGRDEGGASLPPSEIRSLSKAHVVQVVCGLRHTLCVTATSQVYAWGCNFDGQLGLADRADRTVPVLLQSLWAMPVAQLAAGDAHSAALTTDGFLFTWGSNEKGQLGLHASPDAAAQARIARRSASEKQRRRRMVNQRFLTAMAEMGIPGDRAELALAETGNVGVEVATEWLFSIPEDALQKHLATDPNSPTSEDTPTDDLRVLVPRRVPLKGVIAVAAGGRHTVALTEGGVYAWGSNSAGQLGVGGRRLQQAFQDQREPQCVEELHGKHVIQVACGAEHTLFLCREGSLYGCGSNLHGQLPLEKGVGAPSVTSQSTSPGTSYTAYSTDEDSIQRLLLASTSESTADEDAAHLMFSGDVPVPTRICLPFDQRSSLRYPVVSMVTAGGHSSGFLTRAADELPDGPPPLLRERLQNAVAACQKDMASGYADPLRVRSLLTAISMVFGSAAALSATFGYRDKVGIDVELLETVHAQLEGLYAENDVAWPETPNLDLASLRRDVFLTQVRASKNLLKDLENHVQQLDSPERARVVLAVLQSPLLSKPGSSTDLIPRICSIFRQAPPLCRKVLVKWWGEYPAWLLNTRVVIPLQHFLTSELAQTKKLTTEVMDTIKVLAKVEEANQLGRQLPPEAFYNELISDKLDVEDHYIAWRQSQDSPPMPYNAEGPFSFCSYPFLLNPRAKSKLLTIETRMIMTQMIRHAVEEARKGRSTRNVAEDERVLPAKESSIAQPREDVPRKATEPAVPLLALVADTPSRREHQNAVRSLWQTIWRNSPSSSQAASPSGVQADERQVIARELTGAHVRAMRSGSSTPTASSSAGSEEKAIARHGSMNLPKPEDSGVAATHPEMCILRIRRCHLLEDAMNEIARQRQRDLYKPIRVHFIGEDGVDGGGIKKEFFQLLVTEMLSPDYGMLIFLPESRTYWFHANSLEEDEVFMLMGLVLGLAVYNGVLLDFPLPLALYRKLLGQTCSLRDLQDMEPQLGQSLTQLLDFDGPGTVEEVFCQNFTVGVNGIGEVLTVPLKEGGEAIMVTEDNRREYVDMYVNHYLNTSVHRQFEAFMVGFMKVVGGPALYLFNATELERLVCGTPILDFGALERNARYDGGYTPDSQAVKWLWSIVKELSQEEQRRFLKFFTGSDRAPIGGLANQRCVIQRAGPDTDKLPTSHTCFNTLLLPSYISKDKMTDRLRLAIMNSEGFGLE